MYEITCRNCGRVGFHPSRVAAESRAQRHLEVTGHACNVAEMADI